MSQNKTPYYGLFINSPQATQSAALGQPADAWETDQNFEAIDTILHDIAQGGGGGGSVVSIFGRSGIILAESGDYSAFYDLEGAAATAQANAESFATSAVAAETSRAETAEALLAPKASPTFTGTVTLPAALDSSSVLGTTSGGVLQSVSYIDGGMF